MGEWGHAPLQAESAFTFVAVVSNIPLEWVVFWKRMIS